MQITFIPHKLLIHDIFGLLTTDNLKTYVMLTYLVLRHYKNEL